MTDRGANVEVVTGDVTAVFEGVARDAGMVAWDIETSGLDWRLDQIGTCQLRASSGETEIVQLDGSVPDRLRGLLESERVVKIFHHAPFDLRFMRYHWKASPRTVACTKILSKIVSPGQAPNQYSLKPLVKQYLGIELDKGEQVSNWLSKSLTPAQLEYAASDVEYLLPLYDVLMAEARAIGVADLAEASFQYLPARIETDLRGCGDVFAY